MILELPKDVLMLFLDLATLLVLRTWKFAFFTTFLWSLKTFCQGSQNIAFLSIIRPNVALCKTGENSLGYCIWLVRYCQKNTHFAKYAKLEFWGFSMMYKWYIWLKNLVTYWNIHLHWTFHFDIKVVPICYYGDATSTRSLISMRFCLTKLCGFQD